MPKFIPHFETARRSAEISMVRGQLRVSLSYEDFVNLVKSLVAAVAVDTAWYLDRNDDVAEAIARGAIASAQEHFANDGYLEGRMPFQIPVDEQWYLEQNPDVAEGIRTGSVASAQAHFEASGYREGRRPFRM
ncbi:MAG: hypothetical protein KGL52_03375 [Rhodospirillales bacterium]|nr:hypothetical protein [Rhodospirillales bacterium]